MTKRKVNTSKMDKALKSLAIEGSKKLKKVRQLTQNERVLMALSKKSQTRDQLAKLLKVQTQSVGPYLFDCKRFFKAKINYKDGLYTLTNKAKALRVIS